jgi:hypothetical protein
MKMDFFTEAHVGSRERGLNPMIRRTLPPRFFSDAASSGLKWMYSPPNLYAFFTSDFSTVLAVESTLMVSDCASWACSPPSQT